MKTVILFSTIFLGTIAFSQEHQWFIGGGLSANTRTTNATSGTKSVSNWEISPEIGKFVSPRIQIGASINAGENHTKYFSGSKNVDHTLGGGIYSRYLFGEQPFKPFVGVNIGYDMSSSDWFDFSGGTSFTNAYLNAGFAYSLSPRWTVFGSYGMLGYTRTRASSGTSEDLITETFGVNLSTMGNRFVIGMYYNFGNAKE